MKLVLIIPAYNEAPVIGSVLESLPKKIAGVDEIEAVVIDDGSKDATGKIARGYDHVVVVRHFINRGLGGGLGTGLMYAATHGADVAVTLDADGQHDPEEIEKLIEPILQEQADFVVGSRLIHSDGMPIDRIIGNWGLNVFTYIFFGVWTTDSQSGFRAFSKTALEKFEVDLIGMEVSSSFFDLVKRNRLRYKEVPIRPIYTEYSRAKGQRNSNAIPILFKLFYNKFLK